MTELPCTTVLGRALDESYPAEVRRNLTALTTARLWGNACYRFAPPFLAVIARSQHVTLDELGLAIGLSEIFGLTSPLIGRLVDRVPRRAAAVAGLLGIGLGACAAAASTGRWTFALALLVMGQAKVLFDLGLSAWVAEHVSYERRGRVIGLMETSWALGLLVGVTLLGLLTAVTNWRVGYLAGAAAVIAMAIVLWSRLRPDPLPDGRVPPSALERRRARANRPRRAPVRFGRTAWSTIIGAGCLMAASQCLFVTFGSFLKDRFGFGAATLSAVTFVLGGVELFASTTAARRTDRWGKERSIVIGAAAMVPSMIALALWHDHLASALPFILLAIAGFEFGIVSALSIGTQLIPAAPASGLGAMIGAGTLGRALMSLAATRLYSAHGIGGPAILGAFLAALTVTAFVGRARPLAV